MTAAWSWVQRPRARRPSNDAEQTYKDIASETVRGITMADQKLPTKPARVPVKIAKLFFY
jgi:hypothetical protein